MVPFATTLPGQHLRLTAAALAYPAVILFPLAIALSADNRSLRLNQALVTSHSDALGWFSIAVLLLVLARALLPWALAINRLRYVKAPNLWLSLPSSGGRPPKRLSDMLPPLIQVADHLFERYRLNIGHVWPFLEQVISEQAREQIQRAASRVTWAEGARAGALLTVPLSCLLLLAAQHPPWLLFVAPVAAALLWWGYRLRVASAQRDYAQVVNAAVEVHRFDFYRALHLELPATMAEERRQNASLETRHSDEVTYEHSNADGQPIAELRGAVERAVFDSMDAARSEPLLANWSGEVGARIEAIDGRVVDRLEGNHDYQLVVAFGRHVGDNFEHRSVDVRGGRNVDPVAFELLLDGDAVRFPPTGHELLVPVDGGNATAAYRFKTPQQVGELQLWVQVLQLNRLLQVVRLTVDVVTPGSGT